MTLGCVPHAPKNCHDFHDSNRIWKNIHKISLNIGEELGVVAHTFKPSAWRHRQADFCMRATWST